MSQRSVCNQFTPQLWRATKCKFCFNDKESHEKAVKENYVTNSHSNIPTSPAILSPKIKRLSSSFIKGDDNIPRSPTRRNTGSNSDESSKSQSILSSDSESVKTRPSRIKLPSPEDKASHNIPITSPIDNINLRLEMNKQLIAKDDKIHNLEVRNQNLENEIRTLKDQNAALARTQQTEEEHRKMLDKIASLRRKLADMEVKNTKLKEEKHAVEERLKQEEQVVSKLKIKINSMEHEHYLLELRVEREQKHKQSVCQEKEEAEQELESLRKAYRSMQRESRRLSTTFDVDEERARDLEDQLRQTQRRLGMVEVENNRLKEKISKVETERQDSQISSLERQLSSAKENFDESQTEIEELRSSHLSEIQSLQSQISRLQIENDELNENYTKQNLELNQIKRELSTVDACKSESISKDEELQSLRAEVARLQDKCSALCDVELIHINLNKELDRHRDRADKAELQVRHLQREVESERRRREQCVAELEQLRAREEECRQKHRALSASSSAPPIRARASSLEPALFSQSLKKIREPAERDDSIQATEKRLTGQPKLLRKFQSLQNLTQTQINTQTNRQTNKQTDALVSDMYPARSVDNLKGVFEARVKKSRSVSFDASVQEHYYDQQAAPKQPNSTIKDIISKYKNREPRRSARKADKGSQDSTSESSYSYSDGSVIDSSVSEDEKAVQIPERLSKYSK